MMFTTYGDSEARRRALGLLEQRRPDITGKVVSLVEVGSTLHGVTDRTTDDDLDLMAIYVESPVQVMGNLPKDSMVRTQPEGSRSHAGDIDINLYSLRKFSYLLRKGNPSLLQTLFAPPTHIHMNRLNLRSMTSFVRAIQPAADAYIGYSTQQVARWRGTRGQKNVNRPELVEKFGYDTKYAYHAIRLAWQGREFLKTGEITLPVDHETRETLLAVRRGEVTEPDALKMAEVALDRLRHAATWSQLPPHPDRDGLDRWVASEHLRRWR